MRSGNSLAMAMLASTLAACAPSKPAPTAAPPAAASAPDAVSVAQFTALREQWGARDDYAALCENGRSQLQELSVQAQAGQWAEVLAVVQPWTQQCPVDILAQQITATALTKLGREPEAQEHIRMYRGLVDSILASGDGRTPQTAFVVISVAEEYAILRVFQLKPARQALLDGGIDAITVENDGGTATIYFNPAAHWRRMGRTFGEPAAAPR
jgi:hypothetical protein